MTRMATKALTERQLRFLRGKAHALKLEYFEVAGNASMSLRALCDWGIIRRLHKRGERREYFESLTDVWEIFSIIAAERKRREMDPVLETIKQCQRMLDETAIGKTAAKRQDVQLTRQRLAGMEEFMEVTNKIFQQFITNARSGLTRVVKVLLKAF